MKKDLAERVGFEPTVARGDTRSPGAPVRPLQHLSFESGGEGGIRTHARQKRDRFSRAAPSASRSPLLTNNYINLSPVLEAFLSYPG